VLGIAKVLNLGALVLVYIPGVCMMQATSFPLVPYLMLGALRVEVTAGGCSVEREFYLSLVTMKQSCCDS
jgi:hypothetical protein